MTGINWCTETWNIVTGCSWVSPACDNCWAARLASSRLKHQERYAGLANDGKWTGEVRCHEDLLDAPRRWRKPRVVFVCSTGDLFHPSVPSEFLWSAFEAMMDAQQHIFLVLTKRPEGIERMNRYGYGSIQGFADSLKHVWLGVTAENPTRFDERITTMCRAGSPSRWEGHKFVSIEPMLAPIRFGGHRVYVRERCGRCDATAGEMGTSEDICELAPELDLSWVIAGCEKLHGGRPGRPAPLNWFRILRDRCVALGIPFWLKQATDPDQPTIANHVWEGFPLDGKRWLEAPPEIMQIMEAK